MVAVSQSEFRASTSVAFYFVICLRTRRTVTWALALVTAGAILTAAVGAPADAPPPFLPGTHKVLVEQRVSGVRRSYYVHVPVGHEGTEPLPVVVALHGAFSTARKFEQESGFSLLADREGFLVVYPQGIGLGNLFRHWNSGHCCGKARNMNIAAEHPEVVAAVAIVSGTIGGTPAANEPEWTVQRPKQAVAVLAIHGRADASIPYDGGRGPESHGKSSAISVARSIKLWVDADDCKVDPQIESMAQGRVERHTWSGCNSGAEVVLYSINGWGHDWPKENLLGGFDAAGTIWQFFERHRSTPQ